MNDARSSAACAVFKDRIIVSGGMRNDGNILNSVELYEVLPDKWSSMPNMNYGKNVHSLVVVNDKLFVISNRKDTCEFYDNVGKTFITIKSPKLSSQYFTTRAHSIGKKIYVFQYESPILICFDTDKTEWSEELCEVTNDIRYFSSVKVPLLHENF